jgi:hypothetical protein
MCASSYPGAHPSERSVGIEYPCVKILGSVTGVTIRTPGIAELYNAVMSALIYSVRPCWRGAFTSPLNWGNVVKPQAGCASRGSRATITTGIRSFTRTSCTCSGVWHTPYIRRTVACQGASGATITCTCATGENSPSDVTVRAVTTRQCLVARDPGAVRPPGALSPRRTVGSNRTALWGAPDVTIGECLM